MATITPATFTKVHYEAASLAELFDRAQRLVPGLPEPLEVEVHVVEDRSTSAARVAGRDPWALEVDGGAVEDTQRPRSIGTDQAMVTFCRLLFEIADRSDDGFDAPPLEAPPGPGLRAAWETYCVGRTARLGVRVHQPKYRYNLRSRIGFSDAADAAFERLWSSDGLTWADIERAVAAATGSSASGGGAPA